MNESHWDEKLKAFLKKTGDDLKRAGADIKDEADKLMKEVKDPNRQEKVKHGLETFKVWARKTAEEVAGVVETGMKKAEGVVKEAVDTKPPGQPQAAPPPPPPSAPPLRHDTPVDTPAAKTIGSDKKKKSASKPKSAAKKPLGKKRSS